MNGYLLISFKLEFQIGIQILCILFILYYSHAKNASQYTRQNKKKYIFRASDLLSKATFYYRSRLQAHYSFYCQVGTDAVKS